MMFEDLLTILIFTPTFFALIALMCHERLAKWICLTGAALTFAASIPLYTNFHDSTTLAEQYPNLRAAIIAKHVAHSVTERGDAAKSTIDSALVGLSKAEKTPPVLAQIKANAGLGWEAAFEAARHEITELDLACKGDRAIFAKQLRFVKYADWIPAFGIHYFLALDGLSMPLVLLSTLLTLLCLVYSWSFDGDKPIEKRRPLKGMFILFLLLETGLIGVFCALDMFLFYVFWEIVLLPSYFLIGIWGGENRNYAALKFFIYTLIGSVLMLIAMLALYFRSDILQTFNILSLLSLAGTEGFTGAFQTWVFLGLFIAFAIKVPVFPFHTWLPDAHVQAPTAFSVMLAGVMLKMGGYGFFRIAYPLCPDTATHPLFVYGVGILGVVGLLYGAFVALGQSDFKSLVAYSSVSHMGYVMFGLAALTPEAMNGASLQMFNHGASSAMMFLVVGVVYDRAHHRDLNRFGGLALQMPWYFGVAIVAMFASLGLPGLNGFISEFLCFFGAYKSSVLPKWLVISAVPAVVLTAVYILWTIKRVFLGEITNEQYKAFPDLTFNEGFALYPLAVICLAVGVYPNFLLDFMQPAVNAAWALTTHNL